MSKTNTQYKVVYVSDDHLVKNQRDQIVVVPNNYVDNNHRVHYLSFPYANEYIDMMNAFLKQQQLPPPPSDWPIYNCSVLHSYSKDTDNIIKY